MRYMSSSSKSKKILLWKRIIWPPEWFETTKNKVDKSMISRPSRFHQVNNYIHPEGSEAPRVKAPNIWSRFRYTLLVQKDGKRTFRKHCSRSYQISSSNSVYYLSEEAQACCEGSHGMFIHLARDALLD